MTQEFMHGAQPSLDFITKGAWLKFTAAKRTIDASPPLVALAYEDGFLFMNFGHKHGYKRIRPMPAGSERFVIGSVGDRTGIMEIIAFTQRQAAIFRMSSYLDIDSDEVSGRLVRDWIASAMRAEFKGFSPCIAEFFVAVVGSASENDTVLHIKTSGGTDCTHEDFFAVGGSNYCAKHPLRNRLIEEPGKPEQWGKEELGAVQTNLEKQLWQKAPLADTLRKAEELRTIHTAREQEITGQKDLVIPVEYSVLDRHEGFKYISNI